MAVAGFVLAGGGMLVKAPQLVVIGLLLVNTVLVSPGTGVKEN